MLLSELSHEFFSAFENAHATEHKRLNMLWQVFRRKKLRKRSKIATLVRTGAGPLYQATCQYLLAATSVLRYCLPSTSVPEAAARDASNGQT